ncbi:MAG: DUF6295 family protein [Hyphomicrobiaceae bacterium]
MCTSIVEIIRVDGMGKRSNVWFHLSRAVVAYDHARHAQLDEAIAIDFVNEELDPGARAAVELTLDSAKSLNEALSKAIAAAEDKEAERARNSLLAPSRLDSARAA